MCFSHEWILTVAANINKSAAKIENKRTTAHINRCRTVQNKVVYSVQQKYYTLHIVTMWIFLFFLFFFSLSLLFFFFFAFFFITTVLTQHFEERLFLKEFMAKAKMYRYTYVRICFNVNTIKIQLTILHI